MEIPAAKSFDAFAMIVDINHFTTMVTKSQGNMIADFVRDTLSGAIHFIEEQEGEVVAHMGDAILGVLPTGEKTAYACFSIAKDLDRTCEYISGEQPGAWDFAPGGPSLKIAVEYGNKIGDVVSEMDFCNFRNTSRGQVYIVALCRTLGVVLRVHCCEMDQRPVSLHTTSN